MTDSEIEIEGGSINRNDALNAKVALPFGGGSGGGVSITPIAFLVVGKNGVKVVPLDNQTHILERLIDSAPQVVDKIQSMVKGMSAKTPASASTNITNVENQNFIV
ncbi:putative spore protein YtfJ [compost metagenome]